MGVMLRILCAQMHCKELPVPGKEVEGNLSQPKEVLIEELKNGTFSENKAAAELYQFQDSGTSLFLFLQRCVLGSANSDQSQNASVKMKKAWLFPLPFLPPWQTRHDMINET